MRHYTDWLSGVRDGRYNRTRLTWRQWEQITASYDVRRRRLSRRAYLRGYARGQRARHAYPASRNRSMAQLLAGF